MSKQSLSEKLTDYGYPEWADEAAALEVQLHDSEYMRENLEVHSQLLEAEKAALEAELADAEFKVGEVEIDRDCLRDHVAALERENERLKTGQPIESDLLTEKDMEHLALINKCTALEARVAELEARGREVLRIIDTDGFVQDTDDVFEAISAAIKGEG